MKRELSIWQLAGLTFTAVLGTILHFLYDWTGSPSVTPFSAVNESTWEHMKILFFPMLLFAIIQNRFIGKDYPNFWKVKLFSITLGVLLIPVLFYTLNGIFGKTPDFVNILLFFVAAGIAFFIEPRLFSKTSTSKGNVLAILALCLIAAAFVVFTYTPPHIPLFQDPLNRGYGI
jgi:hypothetical protein